MSSSAVPRDAHGPAIDRLLARLARDPRFPAFGASIMRVDALSRAELARLSVIADGVLEDGGLTQELLRVVNTAAYRRLADTGAISTISRAVALLGMDALRSLAMSVAQLEHLHESRPSPAVLLRAVESCVAGDLAREIAHGWPVSAEEAAVCAILQDLGWSVVCRHLPDEATAVEHVRRTGGLDRARAFHAVLGVAPHELGARVAQGWGVDARVLACMAPFDPRRPLPPPRRPLDVLRLCTHGARDAARLLLARPALPPEQTLSPIIERYGPALALTLPALAEAARRALDRVRVLCATMGVSLEKLETLEHGLADPAPPDDAPPVAPLDGEEVWLELTPGLHDPEVALRATVRAGQARHGGPAGWDFGPARQSRIDAGIDALADAQGGRDVSAAIDTALALLRESLGCRRAMLCVRDPMTPRLIGRRGAGPGAAAAVARMSIPIEHPTDLLAIACAKNTDVLIEDATASAILPKLPPWLADPAFDARCFLLLPMSGARGPAGLLYADHPAVDGFTVDDGTLASLTRLRDHLLARLRAESADPRYAAFAAAEAVG